jgi:hypothetical protein
MRGNLDEASEAPRKNESNLLQSMLSDRDESGKYYLRK